MMKLHIQFSLLLVTMGMCSMAHACEHCEAQSQTSAPHAVTVVRDAESGKLRAPTVAEAAALQSNAKSTVAPRSTTRPAMRAYASGAHSARLPTDLASFSVAVRQPDGTLTTSCLQGHQPASEAIQPVQQANTTAVKRETE